MSKRASRPRKIPTAAILAGVYLYLAIVFIVLIRNGQMQLLDPAGLVASMQSKILWAALAFIGVVGTTIIVAFFVVMFRYGENNNKPYKPEWTAGKRLQLLGWGIPSVAILVICVLLWNTAHVVDPYKPLTSTAKAVTIQVVALRWKWLFLYPNDHLASVNIMEIPVGTPINLELTADAPMNSFWVPRLSGQIYAMTGMVTQLHIEADQAGSYAGSAAEISGDGFAGMDFTVNAVSAKDYASWKSTAMFSSQTLDYPAYQQLAEPSSYVTPTYYALADPNLFDAIVMQFMVPGTDPSTLEVRGKSLQ